MESEKSRVVHNATAPNVVDPIGKFKNIDGMMGQIWSRLDQASQDPMVLADVFAAHKRFCEELDRIGRAQVDNNHDLMQSVAVPHMSTQSGAVELSEPTAPAHQGDMVQHSGGDSVAESTQQYVDDLSMISNLDCNGEELLVFADLEHDAAAQASMYYEENDIGDHNALQHHGSGRRRTYSEMSEESLTLESAATSPASSSSLRRLLLQFYLIPKISTLTNYIHCAPNGEF